MRLSAKATKALCSAQERRTVGQRGIRLFVSHYNTAELVGLVGETVEVRFMPHRHESIEVFRRGRPVGTAQSDAGRNRNDQAGANPGSPSIATKNAAVARTPAVMARRLSRLIHRSTPTQPGLTRV